MLRRCWPFLVLLAALATLFPFFDEAGPLHRPEQGYDVLSMDHLAVAKNLSGEHGWLGFYSRQLAGDGEAKYVMYHRFPPLGYVLIKLATLTQPGDLWGQVQAGRMLMLALFAGAAVLACASLVLITGRRWLAVAATLAGFGSYAALRACDMVATEGATDLFGTMLAFHGIARYCFPGVPGVPRAPGEPPRFGQMLAKACVALLLGWHVYALLAPFLGLGAAVALAGGNWTEFRRLCLFGALTLLFGLAVLAQNLGREYVGLGGETPLWDLPTVQSMRFRTVLYRGGVDGLWLAFVADQLWRVGLALVPYAASRVNVLWWGWTLLGALGLTTIFGIALAAAGGWGFRDRDALRKHVQAGCLALLPLALAGHVWATGMRGNMFSYRFPRTPEALRRGWDFFEAMFHVGVPLALFALLGLLSTIAAGRWAALPGIPRSMRRTAAAACVAALWLAFVASAFHMGRLDRDAETAAKERVLYADLDAIRRELPRGSLLYIPRGPERMPLRWRKRFHFTDYVQTASIRGAGIADFAVAARIPGASTLTPDNGDYFLYRMEDYRRHRGPPWRIVGQYPGIMVSRR